MAKCSFCDTEVPFIDVENIKGSWGYLEIQRARWEESFVVIHCPKHAKEYIEFLYLLRAVATIEEARRLIERGRECAKAERGV